MAHSVLRPTLAALALALPGALPATAPAAEPATYRTTVEATDSTEFTVRSGTVGDRCTAWSKIEGTVTTTVRSARRGTLTIYDLPSVGGTLLSHSLLRAAVSTRLRSNGVEHAAFPCGCGPTSELGVCPQAKPDTWLTQNCRRMSAAGGSLGMGLRKRRLYALAGAPIERLLDDCPLADRDAVPDDMGLPADISLPLSALREIERLKVGRQTEIVESFKHAGRQTGCPTGTTRSRESVCGVFRFTMTVERVS